MNWLHRHRLTLNGTMPQECHLISLPCEGSFFGSTTVPSETAAVGSFLVTSSGGAVIGTLASLDNDGRLDGSSAAAPRRGAGVIDPARFLLFLRRRGVHTPPGQGDYQMTNSDDQAMVNSDDLREVW